MTDISKETGSWEERFIKNFCQMETTPGGNSFPIIAYNERNPEHYLAFISSEISLAIKSERDRWIEAVGEDEGGDVAGLDNYDKDSYRQPWEIARNQLRREIKQKLKIK